MRSEEPAPVKITRDLYGALKEAHALVLVTKHREYFHMDLDRILEIMATPVFMDGRNVYPKRDMEERGFIYLGVGKDNR